MKRFLLPLVVAAAMMSVAACGGSDDPKPAANADKPAVALTQADFATKVPAALQDKSTFHAVATTTDEDGPTIHHVGPEGDFVRHGSGGDQRPRIDPAEDRREVLRQGRRALRRQRQALEGLGPGGRFD